MKKSLQALALLQDFIVGDSIPREAQSRSDRQKSSASHQRHLSQDRNPMRPADYI